MEDILFELVKDFVYSEKRKPRIIILNYDNWIKFVELNKNQFMYYQETVTIGKFMMCKVICSNNIKSIELY